MWRGDTNFKETIKIFPRISGSCQCRSLSSSSPGSSHVLKSGRRREREGNEKSNRIRLTKQQLSTWITLFCTFLCRRCTTTTWNCLISRFEEDVTDKNTTLFLFSWTSIQSFRIQLPKKFANIWRNERAGISAILKVSTRTHFLSDVFVAVVLVVTHSLFKRN